MTRSVFTLDTGRTIDIYNTIHRRHIYTDATGRMLCIQKRMSIDAIHKRNYGHPRKVTLKTRCTTRGYNRYTVFSCNINDFDDIFSVFRSNLSFLRKLLWILLRTRYLQLQHEEKMDGTSSQTTRKLIVH